MRALYRFLLPAEQFILDITLAAAAIDAISLAMRGVGIDGISYAATNLAAIGLFGLGLAYRRSQRSERIATALICTGLFIAFSLWLETFNYALMPVRCHPVDALLAGLDATVGYHWADMVAFAAAHPILNTAFRLVYLSTLSQVAGMIAILGLSGRIRDLHVMCLTISIGACVAIILWGLFPSVGPTWLLPHPNAADLARVDPVIGVSGGIALYQLATHGLSFIAPHDFQGVIAFPSFHTVLACALVYAARNVRRLFPVMAAVSLLVLPALLIHGSHHLVDIPGGIIVFCFALACANRIVGMPQNREAIEKAAVPAAIGGS